jgi:hypothetical protein
MRIVPELDHKIRRKIRDARAKDPLISVVALQEQLEQRFNRTFSRKYIAKLAMKVERQGLVEADRTKLEERMQFTRENYRMMREELLKIVYWDPETATPGLPKPLARDDVLRKVQAATDAIDYVVADSAGLTATSTRTVIIEATPSPAIDNTAAGNTASSTQATSTAQ